MVTVAVLSDTHGSAQYIEQVRNRLTAHPIDRVFHLGDNYEDADAFMPQYWLDRVPGTWGRAYKDPMIENRQFLEVEDWVVFLTHTPTADFHDLPSDPDPQSVLKGRQCDIFCHGHTHRPRCTVQHEVLVLNPGHLNQGDDRGYPPTWALVRFDADSLEVEIRELLTDAVYFKGRYSRKNRELRNIG